MFRNFITIAYRNLFRHKIFSILNIVGLALGIAASVLLLQYIGYELSFDKFHSNSENIYRIRHDTYKNGALENSSAISYYGAAPSIKDNFPEVLNFVRLHRADGMMTYHSSNGAAVSYYEKKAFYVDSSFFSIFSFPLIAGDAKKVLRNPTSMLISLSASKKYFGEENPIGKTILLTTEWEGGQYVVDGVFKDIPENSHIKFDFLFSIINLLSNPQFRNGAWYWTNFYNYLALQPKTDPVLLEKKISIVIDKHIGKYLKSINSQEKFILQPIKDIHLDSNIGAEAEVNSDHKIVSFLLIVAFFIIGIAWLNYINLSTAKATERAREVGLRKVLGSNRSQLVRQFLLESFVLTLIAMFIAALIVVVAEPFFNRLVGRELSIELTGQAGFWAVAMGIITLGTFVSGLYPAFVLSSFEPLLSLKGGFRRNLDGINLRKAMVIFQFGISILLIIATLTIFRQLDFMRSQDLGLNINRKVVIRAPKLMGGESYLHKIDHFKEALTANSKVTSVSASSEVPGKEIFWSNEFRLRSEPENIRRLTKILAVDEDFIPTFNIALLAGRNFAKDRASDFGQAVILNESALHLLGITDPTAAISHELVIGGSEFKTVIGVIKDFHQQSLKQVNDPIIIYFIPWRQDYLTLSIVNGNVKGAMSAIEHIYHNEFPENAFEYFFLDEQFDQQYRSEERSWKVFTLFAALSIFIACLGLFGLSSFVAIQRAREIAIRKVLGASVTEVMILISNDFVKLILIAFTIAVPLSWYLMNEWLQGFAYRTSVTSWSFAIAGILTVWTAIFSVGFQSVKAALANPVESIKME